MLKIPCKDVFRKTKASAAVFRKPSLILAALYIVSISAILRADFDYVDDMARVYRGTKGWELSSRYLSNFLSVTSEMPVPAADAFVFFLNRFILKPP